MDPISATVAAAATAMKGGGLATAATLTSAVGTGLSAYGAYASGKAQQAAAEYNADMQRQQAKLVRSDAQENIRRKDQDQQRALARIRAQYGASGLAESGTAADMLGYTAGKFELELADMFTSADRQATALENGASLSIFEGEQAAKAGTLSSLSALSSGAINTFNTYDSLKEYSE